MGAIFRFFTAALVAVLLLAPSVAGAVRGAGELESRVRSILDRYGQDHQSWGILVRSLEGRDDVLSLNSGRLFMPASNLKLLVTAAALDALGPDFRYRTTVMASGIMSEPDSLLDGDLVIRGSGDPTISDRFYRSVTTVWDSLAMQVEEAGIRRVSGSLVVDNTLFEPPYLADGWSWEDLNWWYSAPVSALAYNDNCIDVEVFPADRLGQEPSVRIKPDGSEMRLINQARTVSSRIDDHLVISRPTPGGDIVLGGGLYHRSLGFLEHVTVEDPPRFAANALADALARRGIVVEGPVRVLRAGRDEPDYLDRSPRLVAQHESVPLAEIVRVINKRSHNFYAEQLLFTIGALRGPEGSFEGGIRVEENLLARAGVDTRRLRIMDGSGLSRLNLVTPEMFVRLLAYMDSHQASEEYVSSLPVGGRDNGVRLMRRTAADGRLFAKTGYISSVMALSGYCFTGDDEKVAFSILGNNWLIDRGRARRIIRDICVEIASFRRKVAAPGNAG